MKGAPEVVLDRCADAADARERVERLAAEGLRVIAVADRSVAGGPDDLTALDLDEAARDLTLRGLVALADGVRESTRLAVAQLRAAGVRVLVATGDHPETASAIAAEAGIPDADRVVTGAELLRASDAERVRLVRETAVFARLSPEQKVALVAALRKAGATLAMTGDGVNDAAAIRLADVGVGVGGAGGAESPAARRSADLVLTDADLTRLVDALAEGRAMWARVRDAVAVLVGGNAGEVAFTVIGTALGGRSPLGTRQLLLVNLLTDMFPALAVAVAAPRRRATATTDGDGTLPDDPLAGHPLAEELRAGPHRGFTTAVRRLVLVRGAATAAGATGAWATGRVTGSRSRAGSMGLAALIGTQLAQTAWTGRRSPLVLLTAAGSFAVLVAVVQTPVVSRFFRCRPLDPFAWAAVLGWSVAGAAGAELVPRWWSLRAAQPADDAPTRMSTETRAPTAAEPAETTTGAGVERGGTRGRAHVEQPVGGVAPPAHHARRGRAEQPVGDLSRGQPGIGTQQQRRRARDVRGGHRGARQLLRGGVAGVPVGDDVDTRCEEVDARPAVGERRPPVVAVGRGDGQRGGFAGGGGVAGVLVLVARRDGHGQASCGRCCTARTSLWGSRIWPWD